LLRRPNVRRRSTGSMPYPARIGHFTEVTEDVDSMMRISGK
jgi:hypothetical protein